MTPAAMARAMLMLAVAADIGGCGQNNQYAAPPPPQITVAVPIEQNVTRYFETTGNTASVNSVGRNQAGDMIPLGTMVKIEPISATALARS